MIHIDRSRVPEPSVLGNREVRDVMAEAAQYFRTPERQRKQTRFDFNIEFGHIELADAIKDLFHGKCAYCEQPMDYEMSKGVFDRYRPVVGAIDLDGEIDPDHYWWLAYRWDNLLGACSRCNRAKGTRFPVDGPRAAPEAQEPGLRSERALLLDPCRDRPEEHLAFDANGRVSGTTRRGQVTIEVLALNRDDLVRLRMSEAKAFAMEFESANEGDNLDNLIADHRPFAALRRSLAKLRQADADVHRKTVTRARRQQRQYDTERRDFQLARQASQVVARERGRTRYIERIVLRNIGIHARIELKAEAEVAGSAPWLVLLGENGAGKSTVLKAIAFLLAGQTQWARLGSLATAVLPRKGEGKVSITFTDGEQVDLHIDPGRRRIASSFHVPRYRVIGFGATRLLPHPKQRIPKEPHYARLTNLFDPFCPLPDATTWLLGLEELQFERAGAALKALLNLADETQFRGMVDHVQLIDRRVGHDIRNLSDGYQTVIGMACAIMAGLVAPDQPVETAEGIVLVDELGNHLHPNWRMRIVRGLKRAFPRVQFVATTHEPLCLRGLADGEIAVLRRTGPRTTALMKDLPPIGAMTVDQILSSPHFGLDSTIDPEMADLLNEYYRLLAKQRRDAQEEERVRTLEVQVRRLRPLGNTQSEQILLRTIDEKLARAAKEHRALDQGALPDELLTELLGVLEKAR
jgi:uncharacterized protein (TIGR02646 family)